MLRQVIAFLARFNSESLVEVRLELGAHARVPEDSTRLDGRCQDTHHLGMLATSKQTCNARSKERCHHARVDFGLGCIRGGTEAATQAREHLRGTKRELVAMALHVGGHPRAHARTASVGGLASGGIHCDHLTSRTWCGRARSDTRVASPLIE